MCEMCLCVFRMEVECASVCAYQRAAVNDECVRLCKRVRVLLWWPLWSPMPPLTPTPLPLRIRIPIRIRSRSRRRHSRRLLLQ